MAKATGTGGNKRVAYLMSKCLNGWNGKRWKGILRRAKSDRMPEQTHDIDKTSIVELVLLQIFTQNVMIIRYFKFLSLISCWRYNVNACNRLQCSAMNVSAGLHLKKVEFESRPEVAQIGIFSRLIDRLLSFRELTRLSNIVC